MHNVTLGGAALDKPPAKESESGESTGDASAEPTKEAEPTNDAESEDAADGGTDGSSGAGAKPELVGSSAEPNEESESEA